MFEPPPRPSQSLPQAFASQAMVASAHPQAARVGVETLRRGGSVVDAALATAFAEWVLLPGMCGPGGDVFALVRDGSKGATRALVGAGAAPRGLTPEFLEEQGHATLPSVGVLAASVPGAVSACWDLHRAGGRLPWADLLAPAIQLAREGFPVAERVAWNIDRSAKLLRTYGTGEPYLRDGVPLTVGERLIQPDLADTLAEVAANGPEPFYEGRIAERLVGYCREQDSPVCLDDYASHVSEWVEPLRASYRGWEVVETPPPSQGVILLAELKLVEGWDVTRWAPGSGDVIHLMVEAKKLAFEDRLRHLGDPRFVDARPESLLTEEHVAERRRLIDLERAAPAVPTASGGTSYLAVADGAGNAVSFVHSLQFPQFGCGVIVPGTGVILNNRTGRGFTLEPGHPNRLAGGKRTMSTLNAFMVERNGRLRLVGGTPGGDQQVQWNFQALVNVLDFGLNPQAAVEAPRWQSSPGSEADAASMSPSLWLEDRFPPDVLADLERRGHHLRSLGTWARQGAMQLIEMDEDRGALRGGTDPRAGGLAFGY